ncbi:MAG: cytochrome c oxidase subunit II [Lysobacteraceae bacterium]
MLTRTSVCAMALVAAGLAQANPERWQLNMTPGVTETSMRVQWLHNFTLGICVVIGILVFGAMAVAMFRFRKSKGAVAAQFSHNTVAEIIWTVIPVLILIAMAIPATNTLFRMYDTRESQMTVKVTGYQWLWQYEYLGGKPGENVQFTSRLARSSDETRQLGSGLDPYAVKVGKVNTYLLDVDHPLVLPVDTKIRFVITADDVIHAWWVPMLGWKQDAIPGQINEAWTEIKKPGTYRGQCAELCGKDHGFMPIVVKAVPKAEFQTWMAAQRGAADAARAASVASVMPAPTPAAAPVAAPVVALPADAPTANR